MDSCDDVKYYIITVTLFYGGTMYTRCNAGPAVGQYRNHPIIYKSRRYSLMGKLHNVCTSSKGYSQSTPVRIFVVGVFIGTLYFIMIYTNAGGHAPLKCITGLALFVPEGTQMR